VRAASGRENGSASKSGNRVACAKGLHWTRLLWVANATCVGSARFEAARATQALRLAQREGRSGSGRSGRSVLADFTGPVLCG